MWQSGTHHVRDKLKFYHSYPVFQHIPMYFIRILSMSCGAFLILEFLLLAVSALLSPAYVVGGKVIVLVCVSVHTTRGGGTYLLGRGRYPPSRVGGTYLPRSGWGVPTFPVGGGPTFPGRGYLPWQGVPTLVGVPTLAGGTYIG